MKVLIIGHGRHGKDYAGKYLANRLGLRFGSASAFMAEKFMFDHMNRLGFNYSTWQECFEDRHEGNNREIWFEALNGYNALDSTRFVREYLAIYDVYTGLRNEEMFWACDADMLFDVVVWVDAKHRVAQESSTTCQVTSDMADYIVLNNGTTSQFNIELDLFCNYVEHIKNGIGPV